MHQYSHLDARDPLNKVLTHLLVYGDKDLSGESNRNILDLNSIFVFEVVNLTELF